MSRLPQDYALSYPRIIIMSTYDLVAQTSAGQLGIAQAKLPEPAEDQVVIKVEYSVLGPFDLYTLDRQFLVDQYPYVFGLSAAGTIQKVGAGVTDLKAGDRVTAFTPPTSGNKGLQPYIVQRFINVAKIPDSLSFEKAVSYPDNLVTAYYTLFNQLGLPEPTEWPAKNTSNTDRPILVYGAGATSGQYALQLLKYAGYTNVVAAASKKHEEYLKTLGASHVVDYKSPTFAEGVIKAARGKVELVMDCISLPGSFGLIKQVIKPQGKVAFLAPFKADSGNMVGSEGELVSDPPKEVTEGFPEGVSFISVKTFFYQQDEHLAKTLMPKTLPKLIEIGVQPNRIRVIDNPDPLLRVKEAFGLLRQGQVSGEKLVVKVGA